MAHPKPYQAFVTDDEDVADSASAWSTTDADTESCVPATPAPSRASSPVWEDGEEPDESEGGISLMESAGARGGTRATKPEVSLPRVRSQFLYDLGYPRNLVQPEYDEPSPGCSTADKKPSNGPMPPPPPPSRPAQTGSQRKVDLSALYKDVVHVQEVNINGVVRKVSVLGIAMPDAPPSKPGVQAAKGTATATAAAAATAAAKTTAKASAAALAAVIAATLPTNAGDKGKRASASLGPVPSKRPTSTTTAGLAIRTAGDVKRVEVAETKTAPAEQKPAIAEVKTAVNKTAVNKTAVHDKKTAVPEQKPAPVDKNTTIHDAAFQTDDDWELVDHIENMEESMILIKCV